MFEIWCYAEKVGWISSVRNEKDAQHLAEMYPNTIYFFAELS